MRKTDLAGAETARSGRPGGSPDRARFVWQAGLRRLAAAYRTELPDRLGLPPRLGLMLLCLLLLLGLCALVNRWAAPPGPSRDRAGFDLPADPACSKLDNTSAEAPASDSTSPPQLTLDRRDPGEVEESVPADAPPPAVVQVVQSPTLELAPPAAVQPLEPVLTPSEPPNPLDFDAVRSPHRGDTPMLHTWRMLGLNALLAAALTAAPAAAEPTAADKKLDDIKEELKSLSSIKDDIKNLRALLDLSVQNTRGDIAQLKEQLGRLEKQVKEIEGRLNQPSGRVAFSPSTGGATGRIRLMNTFVEPMSIRVNDRVYRLQPGQTEMLENQPVGGFTFEVLGIQGPAARVLGAGETFTVYVYPR